MNYEPLLEISELEVSYEVPRTRTATVLSDVSLSVGHGEIVGIVGESGSGKSTLASAVMGLLPTNGSVTGGKIRLRGTDLGQLSVRQMREKRGSELVMVFQDPLDSLNPSFRISTQMMDSARTHVSDTSRGTLSAQAIKALEETGIADPARRFNAYPHELSGGMRQRVMIATALQLNPTLLIADEITSALDVTIARGLIELLRELPESRGTGILFISHDLAEVASICDRVVVMYQGRIVEEGNVADVLVKPQHWYTQALLAARPTYRSRAGAGMLKGDDPAVAGPRPRLPLEVPVPAQRLAGQAPDDKDRPSPIVEVENLVVGFKSRWRGRDAFVHAVDGVDLTVRRGEVLGIVGESGAGKSTLGRAIMGRQPPADGRVLLSDVSIYDMPRRLLQKARARIQMVFQDARASLDPRQRVGEAITEPYSIHRVPADRRQSIDELLTAVGLASNYDRKYPHELSGGEARRVAIARCLALRPEVLVADEPTAGLDVSVVASVLELLKRVRDEFGLTYVIITHDLGVLGEIATHVAVMYLGEIVEKGPIEALFERAAHPYTVALTEASATSIEEAVAGKRQTLLAPGEIPSPLNPPSGCRYHTRCPLAIDRCREEKPRLTEIALGHEVACHRWMDVLGGAMDNIEEPTVRGE